MDASKEDDRDSTASSSGDGSEEESRRKRRRHKKEKRKHRRKSMQSSSDESDGGERKKRKRKRSKRRHYSSGSGSEDEEKRAKDGDGEDEEKRRKRRKKRRHRSRSSDEERERRRRRSKRRDYSSGSDDDDDGSSESESERKKKKKLLKEAKKILKGHKGKSDERAKKVDAITMDDYFSKNPEFSTWLKENHGLYFSSLSSDESRKYFSTFVDNYNAGKLSEKYYKGIQAAKRTNHKWNFEDAHQVDEEDERLQRRKKEKVEQKKFSKEHELVMDELLPKATGKDRLLEKKAIQREKNRNRDLSPEPMRETDLMGGGDDFKSMLARERARREKRANVKAEALNKKLSVVEEKETAAMDQFRALIHTSGGKITIPKRGL